MMNDIAYRLDNLICDRIETLVNHAKRLEKSDPDLAQWVLAEALTFASELDDDSAETAIFWCMPLTNHEQIMPKNNNNNNQPRKQISKVEYLARNYSVDELLDERNFLKSQEGSVPSDYAIIDEALKLKFK